MMQPYDNVVHCRPEDLPLAGPSFVLIELTNHCNFRCTFCPTGMMHKATKPRGMMSEKVFEKVLSGLESCRSAQLVHWFNFGESLMHPYFCDYVRRARGRLGHDVRFYLTTNAALVHDDETARDIMHCGLDWIKVSVNSDEMAGRAGSLWATLDGMRRLYWNGYKSRTGIYAKLFDASHEKLVKDTCHRVDVTEVYPMSGITVPGETRDSARDVHFCPFLLHAACACWDGRIVPCGCDWQRALVFGDLTRETLSQAWHGERRRKLVTSMAETGRHGPAFESACGGCTAGDHHHDTELYNDCDKQGLLSLLDAAWRGAQD
jgi:hypothetical protein